MNDLLLPPGWVEANLGDFLEFLYGKSLPKRMREGKGFPVYGSNGIVDYHSQALTEGETLIIGRKGSVGEVSYSSGSCFPIDTTYYADRFYGMDVRYWFHQLKHLNLGELNKATAIPGINRDEVHSTLVKVSPVKEQTRIADKLDPLLARVVSCQERLDRVRLILGQFRQSVLAEATSGTLTQDWRRENNGNYFELESFDLDEGTCFGDFTFPSSWHVCRLEDIAKITSGVTKSSKLQDPSFEEIPYLRVANVQRGYFDLTDVKTIRASQHQIEDRLLESGDILFNEGGDIDKLGRGWVWSGEIERCIFQNHVFRVRLDDASFNPKFFSYYSNSRGADYFLAFGKQTTNLASINKTILSALPVVVPPAEEQHEIVRRIETLFTFADRIETRYQRVQTQVAHLIPTLLDKAFKGELVPQNPEDEPASVLLKRIQEARANVPAPQKKSRMKPDMADKKTTHREKAEPISIIQALSNARQELSATDLFIEAGYPSDADSEQIEAFFVAVRDALVNKAISKARRHNTDWFTLESEIATNEN